MEPVLADGALVHLVGHIFLIIFFLFLCFLRFLLGLLFLVGRRLRVRIRPTTMAVESVEVVLVRVAHIGRLADVLLIATDAFHRRIRRRVDASLGAAVAAESPLGVQLDQLVRVMAVECARNADSHGAAAVVLGAGETGVERLTRHVAGGVRAVLVVDGGEQLVGVRLGQRQPLAQWTGGRRVSAFSGDGRGAEVVQKCN